MWKEELACLREEIDQTDAELIALFNRRMLIAARISQIKRENDLDVQDAGREQQVVDRAVSLADDAIKSEAASLMRTLIALSRDYQRRLLSKKEV